jgi:hypothetical protein
MTPITQPTLAFGAFVKHRGVTRACLDPGYLREASDSGMTAAGGRDARANATAVRNAPIPGSGGFKTRSSRLNITRAPKNT